MIKLKFESAGHPDYSRIVGAEMDKEYTVLGFIDEILKMYPKDYGNINIDDEIFLEYKDSVLDCSFINLRLSGLVVEKVEGTSSYYHTDYKLVSKKDTDKQEKKSPSAELMDLVLEMGVEMRKTLDKYEKKIGVPIHSVTVDRQEDISLSSTYRDGVFGFEIVV